MPGIAKTMHEFKHGNLHSGSKKGPKVKSRAQAIAIGMHSEDQSPSPISQRPSIAALQK